IYEAIREVSIQNVDLGIKTYKELKEKHQDIYQFDNPGELNKLGYELLRMDKKEEAIKMFVLATSEFPDNANLFDSLAEAYFNNEQYDLSLENYKKSLELNPENMNAQKMIEKINGITKK
ncbi:MAG: tetratricopeptide repeat protein, partial [Bacteroidota bacterium]